MTLFKLHYWPVFTFLWFVATFVISYLVSVLISKNVYYFWPMISDTGALPPESCIFGQMLNLAAVFMFITMYIRYRQIDFAISRETIPLRKKWNSTALVVGVLGCLGMSLVANFQETTVVAIHGLGAVMAFGIGSAYFIIQARISCAFIKDPSVVGISKSTIVMRVILSALMLPLFFTCFVCVAYANILFEGKKDGNDTDVDVGTALLKKINSYFTFRTTSWRSGSGDSIQWWTEEDGGFEYRLAGSFTEWIMAFFMIIFTVSFTNEFKTLEYKEVCFECRIPVQNNRSA